MLGALVTAVTDAGHTIASLKASSYTTIDTLRFTPRRRYTLEAVRLETRKFKGTFFNDFQSAFWGWSHFADTVSPDTRLS